MICVRLFKRHFLYICVILGIIFIYYIGLFTHLFEKDYYTEFSYPLEGEITFYVNQIRKGEKPIRAPINSYNYDFISDCKHKCFNDGAPLRIVYIVKSALEHFDRRRAIRKSWGFEKRFSDVPIRTVFILGAPQNDADLQSKIELESRQYGDIIQANFVDTYFNNTIKTMMALKWAMEYCQSSRFYFFADDDFYISTKNVLRFLRNPVNYPAYLEIPIDTMNDHNDNRLRRQVKGDAQSTRKLNQVLDIDLPEDVRLFTGFVFFSAPHRHRFSKWYVPLSEYPYHMWPPYVTAGSYILSKEALIDIYYGSFYTKHFRFDDIYLGLIAKKVNIEPYHCGEFYFYKKNYNVYNYHYVIASHGYGNPKELLSVWNEQKEAGNA